MAGVITTVGLAAEAAAKAAGNSFVPSYIQLGTGRYTPAASRTALATPFSPDKQFTATNLRSSGNQYLGDFADQNLPATYSYGELGVFYTDGSTTTLYYIESTPTSEPILGSKQAGAQRLWTAEISILSTDNGVFTLSPFVGLPSATETAAGVVELADATEGNSGTDNTRAMSSIRTKGYVDNRRATQAEAEAGTDTSKLMTPQRTSQAISALVSSVTLLGSATEITTAL